MITKLKNLQQKGQQKTWLFSLILGFLLIVGAGFLFVNDAYALIPSKEPFKPITQDEKVIIAPIGNENPLYDGTKSVADGVKGLYIKNGKISTFLDAQNAVLAFIQNIINWTLAIIGTVVLVYLLYAGFKIVTAAGDETKMKEGMKSLRTAIIGLLGVGLSALIVNFILYIIDFITRG